MNYEELVKALRSASTVSTAWEKLMHDAAAAIEDLQAQLPKRGEWVGKSQATVIAVCLLRVPQDGIRPTAYTR